jgi:hypothetical protein
MTIDVDPHLIAGPLEPGPTPVELEAFVVGVTLAIGALSVSRGDLARQIGQRLYDARPLLKGLVALAFWHPTELAKFVDTARKQMEAP